MISFNFLRSKMKGLDKDRQDIILSSILLLAVTFVSTALLKDFNIFLVLFIILPAQFLVTKLFINPVKIENSFIVDLYSGKKIRQSFWHLLVPVLFVIFTLVCINLDDIIDTEFSHSNTAKILFFLLPFIITRSYIFLRRFTPNSLYAFIYMPGKSIIIPFSNPYVSPVVEEKFLDEMTKNANEWDCAASPWSRVRRWVNE